MGFGLPLILSVPSGDGWSGSVTLIPMLNSDLRAGHSAGGKLLFYSTVEIPLHDTLRLSLGVAYDTAFGRNRWYPVGGVIWTARPDLEFRLILPSPCVYWSPSADSGVFAVAMPAGNQWRVYDQESEEMVFQTESWRVGVGAEHRLQGPIWIRFATGMDIHRQYEFSRDDTTVWESDVEDTWFASIALVLY